MDGLVFKLREENQNFPKIFMSKIPTNHNTMQFTQMLYLKASYYGQQMRGAQYNFNYAA